MTPPIPKPSSSATLRQWLDYAALDALARTLGGWHKEEMRHVLMLYQHQYPTSPDDVRQAEIYARQVKDAIKAGAR